MTPCIIYFMENLFRISDKAGDYLYKIFDKASENTLIRKSAPYFFTISVMAGLYFGVNNERKSISPDNSEIIRIATNENNENSQNTKEMSLE